MLSERDSQKEDIQITAVSGDNPDWQRADHDFSRLFDREVNLLGCLRFIGNRTVPGPLTTKKVPARALRSSLLSQMQVKPP